MDATELQELWDAYTTGVAKPVNLEPGDAQRLGLVGRYHGPAIRVERCSGVYLNARGELFKDGHILDLSYVAGNRLERRSAARLARTVERAMVGAVEVRGERLIITDRWSVNHYHWLCDALPRLEAWLAHRPGGDLVLPGCVLDQPFVRQSLRAYPSILLDLAGEGHANLRLESAAIVTHGAHNGFQHPELTKRAAGRLKQALGGTADPSGKRRIYVTRAGARMRRMANEDALAPVLARHGFEVVAFEEMTLSEQINLMAETQVLAGPHGAGLANMMFMAPGGAVLEMRQLEGPPNSFVSLASLFGHGHFYLACEAHDRDMHHHGADLIADPERVDAALGAMGEWLCRQEKGPAA